jgi:hypothetical protein
MDNPVAGLSRPSLLKFMTEALQCNERKKFFTLK